MTDMIVSE